MQLTAVCFLVRSKMHSVQSSLQASSERVVVFIFSLSFDYPCVRLLRKNLKKFVHVTHFVNFFFLQTYYVEISAILLLSLYIIMHTYILPSKSYTLASATHIHRGDTYIFTANNRAFDSVNMSNMAYLIISSFLDNP